MHSGGDMPISVYLITICLPLATVLIIFAMKYASAAFQARARLANDAEYQALIENATAAQSETLAAVSAMRGELSRISASLAAVEKILQQVG
ncbi:MAG TPA: hypothetical protein VIJ94_12435 [Caulobacteraceae bacterium]